MASSWNLKTSVSSRRSISPGSSMSTHRTLTRLGREPRRIDAIDRAGHAIAVDKDREHGVMLSQKCTGFAR